MRHCSPLNMLSTHVRVLRCVGPDSLGSLAMTTTTGRKRLLKSESTLFLIYMAFILCHSILWNVGECFLELCNNGQRRRNVQKRHARAKKPGCFAINPNLFLFSVLVAVGRCLVFVEPTSKIRFLTWKACQVSILMAQNGILFLGLHRICSKTSKTKSNIMTQLREVAQGLKMKML